MKTYLSKIRFKKSTSTDGGPRSVHAGPSSGTSGIFSAHVSAEYPSNITPSLSGVISRNPATKMDHFVPFSGQNRSKYDTPSGVLVTLAYRLVLYYFLYKQHLNSTMHYILNTFIKLNISRGNIIYILNNKISKIFTQILECLVSDDFC